MAASLSSKLAKYFTGNSRTRGGRYYLQRRVEIEDASESRLYASVHGSEVYDVRLIFHDGVLSAWCGCPYTVNYGTLCKHVWAVLAASEDHGYLSAAASVKNLRLDFDDYGFEYGDEENEDEDEQEAEYRVPAAQVIALPHNRKLLPADPYSWQRQFHDIAANPIVGDSRAYGWPANREILYQIDVPLCRERGALFLSLQIRDRNINGSWTRPWAAGIDRRQIPKLPLPEDREIVSVLAGTDPFGYRQFERLSDSLMMPSPLAAMLVPMMARTGRCSLLFQRGDEPAPPLILDESDPWNFELEIRRINHGRYELIGLFRRGAAQMDLAAPALVTEGFVFSKDRVARHSDAATIKWIVALRKNGSISAGESELDDFLTTLLSSPNLPPLNVPQELRFQEVTPQPHSRLRFFKGRTFDRQERLRAELSFGYQDWVVSEFDTARGIFDSAKRQFLRRDFDVEKAAGAFLAELGVKLKPPHYAQPETTWELPASKLPRVVRSLLGAGWHVEAENKVFRHPGASRIEVSSGVDWFELRGAVDYGDRTASLPELLAVMRRGENMVLLDDGSYGMVPEEWLCRIAPLAAMGNSEDGHIRFGRSQAGLLDALLAAQPEARCDETFAAVRRELKAFQDIAPSEQPAGFVGRLRDYQGEGLVWMHFLRRFSFGGCLADDMGVGKTAQVLALLETRRELRAAGETINPSLVVVPRSLIFNWKEEVARFTPELRVLDHSDPQQRNEDLAPYDLMLTTYGTLRRDILRLKDLEFDYVVLDESQAIKNANTQAAKAVRLLRGQYRLALSGTPIENHLSELWSLFEFLNPGILGAASAFKVGRGSMRNPDEETRRMLGHALRPFILRRTKEQVARELPPKTEQTMYCEMGPAEHKLYEELRQHYRKSLLKRVEDDGIARSKIYVLEALLRLRQAACHPGLLDTKRAGDSSAKLEMLLERLQEVLEEGHKALVFSQFISLLKIVRERLDRGGVTYEYLDGATHDRQARVERFQNDETCRTFLVSLKAGGLGLNLTAAEYVFILDPWWNPAVEAQAVDRAHRIGQSRPVFAYRLITRGTVEEKVLELQKSKRDLAEAIITADNSIMRTLRAEDLSLLLS